MTARQAGRLDHVVGEERALVEVDGRLGGGAGDVGVRGQVDHRVAARHGVDEVVEVAHVGLDDAEPGVGVVLEVPVAARGEVVEDRDTFDDVVGEQPVDEMAADEARSAHDAVARGAGAASRSDRAGHARRLPLGGVDGQSGVADQEMPEHGAEPLGVRGDPVGIGRADHDARRGHGGGEAAVAPDDAEDRRATIGRELEGSDQVDRHLTLLASTADREHEHPVAVVEPRAPEPLHEGGVPAFVVGPGRELAHVVGRGVGLEVAQLAEVVHGVRGVPGRSAHPQDEQAPASVADLGQAGGARLDRGGVDGRQDLDRLLEEGLAEAHRRTPTWADQA